jgi:hypothetical protein
MYDAQNDTGREYSNQIGLGGNLVPEGNTTEEMDGQYPLGQQYATNDMPGQTGDDNSFHVSQYIEKIHQDPKFSEKEKQFSQKVDDFIKSKTGKPFSAFSGYIFMVNKILMLTTFTEFIFQRFDIVTLFLSFVILLIEIGIFTHKHIYKWLMVLIGSLLLDALVLIDISPVSKIILDIFIIKLFIGRNYIFRIWCRKYYAKIWIIIYFS